METKVKNKDLFQIIGDLTGLFVRNKESQEVPFTYKVTDSEGKVYDKLHGLINENLVELVKNPIRKISKSLQTHNTEYLASIAEIGKKEISADEKNAEIAELGEAENTITFDPIDYNLIKMLKTPINYSMELLSVFFENY